MQILSYGEDAYTQWALKNELTTMLKSLEDLSANDECKAIFRPSFGRRGGEQSAQFGEFDFILLSETHVYLGESKWDRSSELKGEAIELRGEQENRRKILTSYIQKWFERDYESWEDFASSIGQEVIFENNNIRTAPVGTMLANNLYSLLKILKVHFGQRTPEIENVLLYLYKGGSQYKTPTRVINNGFRLIKVNYSPGLFESSNYIELNG